MGDIEILFDDGMISGFENGKYKYYSYKGNKFVVETESDVYSYNLDLIKCIKISKGENYEVREGKFATVYRSFD